MTLVGRNENEALLLGQIPSPPHLVLSLTSMKAVEARSISLGFFKSKWLDANVGHASVLILFSCPLVHVCRR